MKKIVLAVLLAIGFTLTNAQTAWKIDKSHSNVGFSVSHLIISDVTGQFKSYDGTIEFSKEDLSDAKINFSIDVASINTDNEGRDKHLKSDDFFNAEKFPKITFAGKSIKKVDGKKYKLTGDFTMRDVTKTITLDVIYNGIVKDPWGNTKAGFKVTGELNRLEYGLKWNNLMETGGAVVGKDVTITVNLELNQVK
ncbi:MAG: YceI family protein [Ignavibacteria bacterium]|nr:MAG: YceI family protein [Ignavibacteria bacterium]KAF0155642.1 MAG: YceI family protein [Ignavibacteria bacterium]